MLNLIKGEHIKLKNSVSRKLIYGVPFLALAITLVLTPVFVQANCFNWWSTLLLPTVITLLAHQINSRENGKLHYQRILVLPISLRKQWWSRILLQLIYIGVCCILLFFIVELASSPVGIYLHENILGSVGIARGESTISFIDAALGMFVLFIAYMWQIPLCNYLSVRFGLVFTLLFNIILGTVLDIFMYHIDLWYICPYSWGNALMIPLLGILPNGLTAATNHPLLHWSPTMWLVLGGSICFFFLVSLIGSYLFEKALVK